MELKGIGAVVAGSSLMALGGAFLTMSAFNAFFFEMTGGRGPDACIDAVGMEGHSPGVAYAYDKVKTALMMETDRPVALRQAILACRSGGTVTESR